jgi:hypothetical protein
LLSIFIIIESYRIDGIKKNPFGGILFEIYNKTADQYEKKFIAEILVDNKKEKVSIKIIQFNKLKIEVLTEEA